MEKRFFFFIAFLLIFFLSFSTAHAQSYCFNRAAFKYGLPVSLIKAVAYTESGFNPSAIDYDKNGTYDYGVMQINTIWYKQLKPYWNNLADPCYNVEVGAWILYRCKVRYGGVRRALACYNSGSPDVNRDKGYVYKVLAFERKF
jgi:soluble lytic murein transglycosylase-like protein